MHRVATEDLLPQELLMTFKDLDSQQCYLVSECMKAWVGACKWVFKSGHMCRCMSVHECVCVWLWFEVRCSYVYLIMYEDAVFIHFLLLMRLLDKQINISSHMTRIFNYHECISFTRFTLLLPFLAKKKYNNDINKTSGKIQSHQGPQMKSRTVMFIILLKMS